MKNVIATYGLTNNSAIVIFEVDPYGEYVIAGFAGIGDKYTGVRRSKIRYDRKGRAYFNKYNMRIRLDYCLKV